MSSCPGGRHNLPLPLNCSFGREAEAEADDEADQGGFTLLELLLAVVIFAIVLTAINTVFYSALHLERATSRVLDQAAPIHQAWAIMRRDLLGAVPPTGVLQNEFKVGSLNGGMSLGQSGGAGIEFCTSSGQLRDDAPWGDIQRVSYQLRDPTVRDGSHGKDLIRTATRNLLATTTPEAVETWLMSGVESLDFELYANSGWRNSWDSTMGDTNLPTAVRVSLLLASDNATTRVRQPLQMVVPLVMQATTNSTDTASTGGGQ